MRFYMIDQCQLARMYEWQGKLYRVLTYFYKTTEKKKKLQKIALSGCTLPFVESVKEIHF